MTPVDPSQQVVRIDPDQLREALLNIAPEFGRRMAEGMAQAQATTPQPVQPPEVKLSDQHIDRVMGGDSPELRDILQSVRDIKDSVDSIPAGIAQAMQGGV